MIHVFSTPTCSSCKTVKTYLDSKNVSYTEKNVHEDSEAMAQMMSMTGSMTVPVIYDDEKKILSTGFNRAELDTMIG